MDYGIRGKRALVPGATSGLGRAVAQALDAEGAHVVVAGRRQELVEEVASGLDHGEGVVIDLVQPGGPEALASAAGDVDILILNGGGPPPSRAVDMTADDAITAAELLLAPHVRLIGCLLPGMRRRGWGRIVAIGSTGIQSPLPYLAGSNVGRSALAAYLKALTTDVSHDGVTVNMVLPSRIDTDRVTALDRANAQKSGHSPEDERRSVESLIPVGRYGTPAEFAAVVAFLSSEAASFVTGEQIRCDGGFVSSY